jgi:hypothetical protein
VQSPDAGQVSSQLPAEQSIVHGGALHEPWQLPDEQPHIPPEQATSFRGAPVPGSETAGPPLGDAPPPPTVLLDPLHPTTTERMANPILTTTLRMTTLRTTRLLSRREPFVL